MNDQLYIPIAHYPPFQLRSSLIDKDPVIWAHLLEGYIDLCQVLLNGEVKLNIKSQQQLQLFLKVFLYETSQELMRIFSLGAINPDIKKNTAVLRAYVFQLIRDYGFVKLALPMESLWHFVVVYVEKNATTVRGLLNGTLKSKFNDNKKSGKISQIPPLRQYLQQKVQEGQLDEDSLRYFSTLLGQHTSLAKTRTIQITGAGSSKPRVASDRNLLNSLSALQFAEVFVSAEWVEALESNYAAGRSVHADLIRNVMVISILSLTTAKISSLISTLGIHSSGTMMIAPLLCSIIISESYISLAPGLDEHLPFLKLTENNIASGSDVALLQDMFPELSPEAASAVLIKHENNIDQAINHLLENPEAILAASQEIKHTNFGRTVVASKAELEKGLERFSLKDNETNEILTKLRAGKVSNESKEKTLTHALRLLYESDEDERDDTYDDVLNSETSSVSRSAVSRSPNVDDEEPEMNPKEENEYDRVSLVLFGFLKNDGESVFNKTNRKSPQRALMRTASKWSDEQVEGWFRMLKQSPRRFRLLEEQYVTQNSNKALAAKLAESNVRTDSDTSPRQVPKTKGTLARKEKNKSRVGNHSRKKNHDKKSRADLAGLQ